MHLQQNKSHDDDSDTVTMLGLIGPRKPKEYTTKYNTVEEPITSNERTCKQHINQIQEQQRMHT